MQSVQLPTSLEELVERLTHVPGVVAISLGGSRARGEARPDSDWDFGLYYRGTVNPDDIRALGYSGHVVAPGAWGRLVNGGGWLVVDGLRVDVLYRDLDKVTHWLEEARQGRFEVDNVAGHIVGLPTYVAAGELATGKVLSGQLLRPTFPDALRRTAPPWWYGNASFSLFYADGYAARGEVTGCVGSLARAIMAVAHARLAERGEWTLNEKRLVQRAGLTEAEQVLASIGLQPEGLTGTVQQVRQIVGLARPRGMQADEVVQQEQ